MIKKEYETYWSLETLLGVRALSSNAQEARFFERGRHFSTTQVIVPEDVPYLDLVPFIGKKTKITIEVIE